MVVPSGLNATSKPDDPIALAGFENLVPKPDDQGYTEMCGLVKWLTAIAVPSGLKVTE
jgi:hypothetical protein